MKHNLDNDYIATTTQGNEMTKAQREELRDLKQSVGQEKARLIAIWRQIERISPSQAEKLEQIIFRLERFQVT